MGRGSILQGQILGSDTPREVNQRLRDEVTEMGVEVKMLRAQVSRLDIEREEIALVCERHARRRHCTAGCDARVGAARE